MIFLWVQIVVMIFLWFGYVFLWFWIRFFYDFFYGFLVLRIWFSAKNTRNFRFFYDFARVSLGKSSKNRKKIVNASKVPRI